MKHCARCSTHARDENMYNKLHYENHGARGVNDGTALLHRITIRRIDNSVVVALAHLLKYSDTEHTLPLRDRHDPSLVRA